MGETQAPTGRSTTTSPRTDHFYLENLDGRTYEVRLTVSRGEDPVVDGTYEVPERTGLVFEDVGIEGNSYGVVAETAGGDSTSGQWDVESCDDSEATAGNRDGAIRFEDSETRLIRNACDAIGVGVRDVPYRDADEYEQ